ANCKFGHLLLSTHKLPRRSAGLYSRTSHLYRFGPPARSVLDHWRVSWHSGASQMYMFTLAAIAGISTLCRIFQLLRRSIKPRKFYPTSTDVLLLHYSPSPRTMRS